MKPPSQNRSTLLSELCCGHRQADNDEHDAAGNPHKECFELLAIDRPQRTKRYGQRK